MSGIRGTNDAMKTLIVSVAIMFAWLAPPVTAQRPTQGGATSGQTVSAMTNADVVKLAGAGVGDALIVQAIGQAKLTGFDVSPDAIVRLKTAGISDAVIAAMLNPKVPLTASPAPSAPSAPLPASAAPREPGIYLDPDGDRSRLLALEPTVFSQAKAGGMFLSGLTYGAYKAKIKAVVRVGKAKVRTSATKPIFYFYFDQKSAGSFGGWLSGAASPNEFILAQMIQKKDSRELVVGEMGLYTSSTGARSKDIVPLDVQKLGPGEYRVVPTEDLGAGEFCFFYAAGMNALGGSTVGKLFDFGADTGRR